MSRANTGLFWFPISEFGFRNEKIGVVRWIYSGGLFLQAKDGFIKKRGSILQSEIENAWLTLQLTSNFTL